MNDNLLIDATFNVFGMVGNPVSQTQTPSLFNQYCRVNNHAAVMVPFKLSGKPALEDLIQMMKDSQFLSGFVSTIPFKANLYDICDIHGPAAAALGKVNTVKISTAGQVVGEMFDGIGFVEALNSKKFSYSDAKCLVIGCGAAGQAIALELIRNGISNCTIIDTNAAALNHLKNIMSSKTDSYELSQVLPADLAKFDLIINASPLGMLPDDPLPCDLSGISADCFVGDCVTNFETTAFLKAARGKGCPIITGADMANGQLMSILKFFGVSE